MTQMVDRSLGPKAVSFSGTRQMRRRWSHSLEAVRTSASDKMTVNLSAPAEEWTQPPHPFPEAAVDMKWDNALNVPGGAPSSEQALVSVSHHHHLPCEEAPTTPPCSPSDSGSRKYPLPAVHAFLSAYPSCKSAVPSLLAPGTGFIEDNFFQGPGWGTIHTYYLHAHLLLCGLIPNGPLTSGPGVGDPWGKWFI